MIFAIGTVFVSPGQAPPGAGLDLPFPSAEWPYLSNDELALYFRRLILASLDANQRLAKMIFNFSLGQ